MRDPRDEPAGEPQAELGDEELILFHYGEAEDPAAVAEALASSPAAARRYAELQRLLAAADLWQPPEPAPDFEADLWRRLHPALVRPALRPTAHRFGAGARRWLPAAAAAMLLLVVGYLAGRLAPVTPEVPAASAALSAEARERLLVETLAQHLERSQRLFTELTNATPGEAANLTAESGVARELLSANRLYRTAAERGEREGIGALLAQMEPLLLDLANLPADPAAEDLDFLRQRLEAQGLLFKTRVASDLLDRSLRTHDAPAPRPRI